MIAFDFLDWNWIDVTGSKQAAICGRIVIDINIAKAVKKLPMLPEG